MSEKYTNPDPRLHISLLKTQYNIFNKVKDRMVKESRYSEAAKVRDELKVLNDLIIEKTYNKQP